MHVWRKRECTCGGRGSACVEEEGVHVWRKRECTCGFSFKYLEPKYTILSPQQYIFKPGYAYKRFSINAELTIVSMAFSEQYR